MIPIRAIIWDVDGTLVDTADLHYQAWQKLAAEMGRPLSREEFNATFGRRNPEIIRGLFNQQFSDAEVLEIGTRKEEYYKTEASKGINLLPGVLNLLQGFAQAGVKQAIGSSAPQGNLELILKMTETEPFFSAIVGMEDTQRGKPDPEVFLVAAARIGVAPYECVVLEDAVAGIQAAKAAGMRAVGVTFVGHHSAEKLIQAGADRVVPCFTEISAAEILSLANHS
ncbi:MAG: HAD family phosphatase [Gemmataceae bacterium]|nr:HAD family phosphatase [Gemmataceae bacterium]